MAVYRIETAWKSEYQRLHDSIGTRTYPVSADRAYSVVRQALASLGMDIDETNTDGHTLLATALAPRPLTNVEWERVREIEEPQAKELASQDIGILGAFLTLHTKGVIVHIAAAVSPVNGGTTIAIDYRIRDTQAIRRGLPSNEYAPPTAVRLATAKIWAAVDALIDWENEGPAKTADTPI